MSTTSVDIAGSELIHDIFRRADKDDNMILTFDEFVAMFGDTELSDEQLRALFAKVDADHSGSIETSELASFFVSNLAGMEGLFGAVDGLNDKLAEALAHVHKVKQTEDAEAKAVQAFFLRQISEHLGYVADAIEASHKSLQPNHSAHDATGAPATILHQATHAIHGVEGQLHEYSHRISASVHSSVDALRGEIQELRQQFAKAKTAVKETATSGSSDGITLIGVIAGAAVAVAVVSFLKFHKD